MCLIIVRKYLRIVKRTFTTIHGFHIADVSCQVKTLAVLPDNNFFFIISAAINNSLIVGINNICPSGLMNRAVLPCGQTYKRTSCELETDLPALGLTAHPLFLYGFVLADPLG